MTPSRKSGLDFLSFTNLFERNVDFEEKPQMSKDDTSLLNHFLIAIYIILIKIYDADDTNNTE